MLQNMRGNPLAPVRLRSIRLSVPGSSGRGTWRSRSECRLGTRLSSAAKRLTPTCVNSSHLECRPRRIHPPTDFPHLICAVRKLPEQIPRLLRKAVALTIAARQNVVENGKRQAPGMIDLHFRRPRRTSHVDGRAITHLKRPHRRLDAKYAIPFRRRRALSNGDVRRRANPLVPDVLKRVAIGENIEREIRSGTLHLETEGAADGKNHGGPQRAEHADEFNPDSVDKKARSPAGSALREHRPALRTGFRRAAQNL